MSDVTISQMRRFYGQLRELGLDEEMKHELISQLSSGRTTSVKQLSFDEMREMVNHLENRINSLNRQSYCCYMAGNQQRRRIMSICHQLPPELGFTRWDEKEGCRVVDMHHLNSFLTGPKSIFKKKLNYHTPSELSKVIVQFENMLSGYLNRK